MISSLPGRIPELLGSRDLELIKQAFTELRHCEPLSLDQALACLELACRIPDYPYAPGSVASNLVGAAKRVAAERPAELSLAYPRLDEEARSAALALLAKTPSDERVELYVELVVRFGWPERTYSNATLPLERAPELGERLFPRLFELEIAGSLAPSYRIALAHCRAGKPPTVPAAALVRDCAVYLAYLEPRQQSEGVAWRFAEDYEPARYELALALDLLGYAETSPEVERTLERALALGDPRPRHFALASSLRLGLAPDPDAFEAVAASREMRAALFRALEELDHGFLFPDAYRLQELLAESAMVDWLCFPTELGREPDEIELMDRGVEEPEDDEEAEADGEMFVFRFRTEPPHWAAERGWMAGWAGPFPAGRLSADGGGSTFSEFQPWDEFVADAGAE